MALIATMAPAFAHALDMIAFAAALRPMLDAFVILFGGFFQQAGLVNVVAARFLDIDVLICHEGRQRDRGMPVIRGGDADRVDRLVLE